MATETQTDGGRSRLGTMVLLALTFAVGYVLGSRGDGETGEWEDVASEPTEITIDGDDEGEE